jgi:hypothetical protein
MEKKLLENGKMMNLLDKINKKIGLIIYVIILIIIFLFPPVNRHYYGGRPTVLFEGWTFISNVGDGTINYNINYNIEINVTYLLIEIGVSTMIYLFFLYSQKK